MFTALDAWTNREAWYSFPPLTDTRNHGSANIHRLMQKAAGSLYSYSYNHRIQISPAYNSIRGFTAIYGTHMRNAVYRRPGIGRENRKKEKAAGCAVRQRIARKSLAIRMRHHT